MANVFVRAFRRSGVRLKYSQGYHPKPKLAFMDALPVGMESHQEYLVVNASGEATPEEIVSHLNTNLPEGLRILDCCIQKSGTDKAEAFISAYRVVSEKQIFDERQIRVSLKKSDWSIKRTNRKGKTRQIDLKQALMELECVSGSELQVTLRTAPGHVVRPGEVVAYVFDLPSDDLRRLRVIKTANRIVMAV
jgi:radical SAM-linked protein